MKKKPAFRSAFFNPRVLISLAFCLVGIVLALLGFGLYPSQSALAQAPVQEPAQAQYRGLLPVVYFDVSPPLRDIPPIPPGPSRRRENEFRALVPRTFPSRFGSEPDPVVQSTLGPIVEIPGPIVSFDGPSNTGGGFPPDPTGEVGPKHFVVMFNSGLQVFDKAGMSLMGPVGSNIIWAGLNNACQFQNDGDPIVLYDQLADRWILSQFTSEPDAVGDFYLCVAISQAADPTGAYFRYAFSTPTQNFPDYPKYGVWPDAYYISTTEFVDATPTGAFLGVGAYALNRAQMIVGNAAPQVIAFLVPPGVEVGDGLLPSDLDGTTLPPGGSPNYFLGTQDNNGGLGAPFDALNLWKFHVDFATPANSTFTGPTVIRTAPFNSIGDLCERDPNPNPPPMEIITTRCIPQPDTEAKVDHLGYLQRPLHRLAYRNFGDHESLVTNQSVSAGTSAFFGEVSGIRWWELRNPNGNPLVIFQQGTYAPGLKDGIHRWMGSIAMDGAGNIALGYSASSSDAPGFPSVFPSVWYTGRLANDAPGVMTLGENSIIDGIGSQIGVADDGGGRWGDYTALSVDPTDDLTFWYVNEYVPTTSLVGWRLRIGSFKAERTPSTLDHFKAYVTNGPPNGDEVLLRDQFDPPVPPGATPTPTPIPFTVGEPFRFANPVEKTHNSVVTPIMNEDTHLKMYLLLRPPGTPTPTPRYVQVYNQFRPHTLQTLQVKDPVLLGVPTQKNGIGTPHDVDHFKFYNVAGYGVNATVDLLDQFHEELDVPVRQPRYFGLPVQKTHNNVVTPILHPQDCLVCYDIVPQPFDTTITTDNQFGPEKLEIEPADLLCVPSQKLLLDAPPLDHFKAYVITGTSLDEPVMLRDQFDPPVPPGATPTPIPFIVDQPRRFANPVQKTHNGGSLPINNQETHLKMYLLLRPPGIPPIPMRSVQVSNQFDPSSGPQTLTVRDPVLLGVPTRKNAGGSPHDVDHFKFYDATGDPVNQNVDLLDQFHLESGVQVGQPRYLGLPVEKTHNNVVTPITHPQDHLVCYDITPRPFSTPITTENQFGFENLMIQPADLLCVPSQKLAVATIPTPTPTPSPSPTCPPGLTQGFDDITTLPAAGWVQTNHSTTIGTTGWFQGNDAVFPSHQGAANSYIGANFNNTTGTNTISNWLLTPTQTLQNGVTMTFWTRTTTANPFPDRLQVRMSTNGTSQNVGVTATDVGDFNSLLLDINPTYTVGGYPEVWTQQTVTITGVSSATLGRLAFRYFVENGGPTGSNSNYIGIDTFQFNGACGGTTPVPTPTLTPGITPSPTPTATIPPTPTPAAQAVNLSTRMRVQTGDGVGIGGFIINGSARKHVLLRAIGPSLTQLGVPNALGDPVLELHGPGAFATITNNNWRDDPVQEAAILATGLAPTNNLESAIDATLDPGAYTAIVKGNGNTSGVALVEIYDLNQSAGRLANISTRAFVSTGDNVVIAGFILGGQGVGGVGNIILRGIGPSLAPGIFPASAVLANPTLELRDANGTLLRTNNDWQDDPAQAAEISAAGLAPTNNLESAISAPALPPGPYTALLAGMDFGNGIGLVEVFDLGFITHCVASSDETCCECYNGECSGVSGTTCSDFCNAPGTGRGGVRRNLQDHACVGY